MRALKTEWEGRLILLLFLFSLFSLHTFTLCLSISPTAFAEASNLINTAYTMFRSPIQPAEPFSFWSPSPSPYTCRQSASPYSYAYHDPLSLAIMQQRQHEEEQAAARRQQAAVMQRRRAAAAYEAQLRKKELARRRAQQEAAAEAEYKAALVDRIMRAYATQHQQEQQAEEEDIEQEELPSQSRMIPIASFESDNESEVSSEEDETCDTTASNTSSHVPETARDQPKITYEEAVNIIHKHAQIAITIRQRLRSLNKIRSNFQSQQRSFRPPRT